MFERIDYHFNTTCGPNLVVLFSIFTLQIYLLAIMDNNPPFCYSISNI